MRLAFLVAAAGLLAAASTVASAAGPANSAWPMFEGNAQHTSSTTFGAPTKPQLQFIQSVGVTGSYASGYGVSIGPDGSLYLLGTTAGNNYSVVALGPNGSPEWTYPIGTNLSQPAVSNDGQVYVSSAASITSHGYSLSLSTSAGALLWNTRNCMTTTGDYSSPLLGPTGNQYYGVDDTPQDNTQASCFSALPSTGTILWSAEFAGDLSGGALSPDGSLVYDISDLDKVQVYDAASGSFQNNWYISNSTSISIGPTGTIFVKSQSSVDAYNPDGTQLWPNPVSFSQLTFYQPPVVAGNDVFLSYNGSVVTALNAATGATIWSTDLCGSASIFSAAPSTCASSTLIGPISVGGNTAFYSVTTPVPGNLGSKTYLVAVDTGTGVRKWAVPAPMTMGVGQIVPAGSNLYYSDGSNVVAYSSSAASQFSVSISSFILSPGSSVTFTASVLNSLNNPVPNIPVQFEVLGSSMAPAVSTGVTNANGTFSVSFTSSSLNSSVVQTTATVKATCLDFAPINNNIYLEGEAIDHFDVSVPTTIPIGVPFPMSVLARNAYDHGLPSFPGTSGPVTATLSPYLTGTLVAGSGSFGQTSVGISNGTGTITSQTYNKIESIQIKAIQQAPGTAVGLSTAIAVTGPTNFVISIPTGTSAGQQFPMTITAVSGGTQVAGYSATLSLSALLAATTTQAATGTLGVTSVNMPPSGQVTIANQTYSRGDGIVIKASDSGLGISGVSSSMTVVAPGLTIDHYQVVVATQMTVGLPFSLQANALDASSSPVTYTLNRNLNIQAYLSNTSVAGSGSLGIPSLTLTAGTTFAFTAAQTYNKIESIQLRVTDDDGRTGISAPVVFNGPTQFVVSVPTAAQAGVPFQFVVQAEDGGGNQVLGYDGTVSISAVNSATTSVSGAGVLGVTNLNLSGGAGSTAFQTYTAAQGIRFRVADSGIGVASISSSMTVSAGPPAVLNLTVNPQSTIASVPSILTAVALDAFSNPVAGSTVTFSVAGGSGTLALSLTNGAVAGAAVSTQAPTDVTGSAQTFFGSGNLLSSQADYVTAQLGGLGAGATIYNAVLITPAGGEIVNLGNPSLSVTAPASTWGYNVRLSIQQKSEMNAATLALTTAAFAAQPNTFVSTTAMNVVAVRDASPTTPAGPGGRLTTVTLPYVANVSSVVTVGGYRGQSILVPASVLRVFKLNNQTSVFDMVLDGTNLPVSSAGVVAAQVYDPSGIFALGVPPYATLGAGSSGTITSPLASGAMASVSVPFGAFSAPTTLTVTPADGSSLQALPALPGLSATGIAVSVSAGGAEPSAPVTVSLGYTTAQIGSSNPNQFRLARYDAGSGWQILESQVDTLNGAVSAQTNNFSIFEIVSETPGTSVGQGYVYPNPFRPALGHTRIKFAGFPASADIRIFTVSGRLLDDLSADSTGSVLDWAGVDSSGRPLPSGVYLAVVTDTTGGSGRITLKFAVQR